MDVYFGSSFFLVIVVEYDRMHVNLPCTTVSVNLKLPCNYLCYCKKPWI